MTLVFASADGGAGGYDLWQLTRTCQ